MFHLAVGLGIKQAAPHITGGLRGLMIPMTDSYQYTIGSLVITSFRIDSYYYLTLAILLITFFSIYRMLHSDIGLTFKSIRDDIMLAESLGVNIYRNKLKVFFITSFFTGVAGAHYSNYLGVASPAVFEFDIMVTALAMLFVGGIGHFYGPIVGVFTITFVSDYLLELAALRYIIFGVLIFLVILLSPSGIGRALDHMELFLKRRLPRLHNTILGRLSS